MKKKSLIPEKTRIVGGSGQGNRKIYISRDVYKDIFAFSKDKNVYQSGGILLGNFIEENGVKYIIIRAFVEGMHSEGTSTSLTFTKDTWNYIDVEKEKYPEYEVVGWMHTNPDTGRRASEYDLFFHTHMFDDKNLVVYIVDPVQIAEAFYYLEGEQLVRSDGFYVFTEAVMPKLLPKRKSKGAAEELEELEIVEVDDTKVDAAAVAMEMSDEVGTSLVEDMAQAMEKVEEMARAASVNPAEDILVSDKNSEAGNYNDNSEKTLEVDAPAKDKTANVSGAKGNVSLDNTSEIQMRQVFEEAEKKVEEDNSDVEAFIEKAVDTNSDKIDTPTPKSEKKGSTKVTVLISILLILVIGMAVVLVLSFGRIAKLESKVDALYRNDKIIAKYINTGKVEGDISTPDEAATSATEETTTGVAVESESVAVPAETNAEGNADAVESNQASDQGETQAETQAEAQAESSSPSE